MIFWQVFVGCPWKICWPASKKLRHVLVGADFVFASTHNSPSLTVN